MFEVNPINREGWNNYISNNLSIQIGFFGNYIVKWDHSRIRSSPSPQETKLIDQHKQIPYLDKHACSLNTRTIIQEKMQQAKSHIKIYHIFTKFLVFVRGFFNKDYSKMEMIFPNLAHAMFKDQIAIGEAIFHGDTRGVYPYRQLVGLNPQDKPLLVPTAFCKDAHRNTIRISNQSFKYVPQEDLNLSQEDQQAQYHYNLARKITEYFSENTPELNSESMMQNACAILTQSIFLEQLKNYQEESQEVIEGLGFDSGELHQESGFPIQLMGMKYCQDINAYES